MPISANLITYLGTLVGVLSLLWLTLRSGSNPSIRFTFSGLCLSLAVWVVTLLIADFTSDYSIAFIASKSAVAGPAFIAAFFLDFSRSFPNPKASYTFKGRIYIYGASLLLTLLSQVNGFFVKSVELNKWGVGVESGPGYIYLFALLLFYFIVAITNLIGSYLHTQDGRYKSQIKLILYGFSISAVVAILTNLVLVVFGISNSGYLGPPALLVFVLTTSYAIVRHQLFDIRVVIKRIFLYTLLLGFVFGVYSLVIQTLSGWLPLSRNVANFVAALVLAFSFDPVRRTIARWTEQFLFVSEYKANDVIKELSDKLTGVVDLDEALRLVVKIVTSAMRVDRGAAVVVRPGDDGKQQLHVGANVAVPAPTRLIEESMMPLVDYLELVPDAILTGQLQQQVENDELAPSAIRRFVFRNGKTPNHQLVRLRRQSFDQLTKLKLGATVPVVVNKKLICVLLLGEKLSDDIYFTEDIKFLQLVASTMASAIEKARFYEENQIKSEFVSIASHELLTPTAAIEGYLSMILVEKMGKVDKQAEQYLQVVYKSAQRLAVLVKDLLAMSRIEGNRIQIVPKYFDLGALVKEQIMTIMPRAAEKDLKLVLKDIPKGELKSYADPEKVTQIFVNLVGNAIKYTKKGGVTISVADHGTHWEIAVADTGVGMSANDRQHLFEKFYRIQNDNTMGITGTGLGLYISKSLITMMGGDITVESTEGKGSTFAFTVAKKPNHAT